MTNYSMTPIQNGTRLRTDHNVSAALVDVDTNVSGVQSFNANDLLLGDVLWEAPADGQNVKKGDKWLHVTHRNGVAVPTTGWTAYIHLANPICDNFKEIPDVIPPDPGTPVFPESFVLTDPSGAKAEYVFVRIIEE